MRREMASPRRDQRDVPVAGLRAVDTPAWAGARRPGELVVQLRLRQVSVVVEEVVEIEEVAADRAGLRVPGGDEVLGGGAVAERVDDVALAVVGDVANLAKAADG